MAIEVILKLVTGLALHIKNFNENSTVSIPSLFQSSDVVLELQKTQIM